MRRSRMGDVRHRFFLRIDKSDPGGCWIWRGTLFKTKSGTYGVISGPIDGVRYGPAGSKTLAHRASWILHHGPIPEGEGHHGTVVMHKCDRPLCVNPEHLMLGTQTANVEDMDSKQRGNRTGLVPSFGTAHRNAVLNAEQVAEIVASTETNGVLAERFGVSKHTIKRLRCGKTYSTETDSEALKAAAKNRKGLSRPGTLNPTAKLTDEQVRYARSHPGIAAVVAAELGIEKSAIVRLRRRATYANVL